MCTDIRNRRNVVISTKICQFCWREVCRNHFWRSLNNISVICHFTQARKLSKSPRKYGSPRRKTQICGSRKMTNEAAATHTPRTFTSRGRSRIRQSNFQFWERRGKPGEIYITAILRKLQVAVRRRYLKCGKWYASISWSKLVYQPKDTTLLPACLEVLWILEHRYKFF